MRGEAAPGRGRVRTVTSRPPLGDLNTGCGRSPDLSPTRFLGSFASPSPSYRVAMTRASPRTPNHRCGAVTDSHRVPYSPDRHADPSGTSSRHMPFVSIMPTVTSARWVVKAGRAHTGRLCLHVSGAPGRNRTCDPVIRSHLLYPLSYGRAGGAAWEPRPEG